MYDDEQLQLRAIELRRRMEQTQEICSLAIRETTRLVAHCREFRKTASTHLRTSEQHIRMTRATLARLEDGFFPRYLQLRKGDHAEGACPDPPFLCCRSGVAEAIRL